MHAHPRTLRDLEREAALRHPDPAHPEADTLTADLAGEGLRSLIDAPPTPIAGAWLQARARFFDRAIRRASVPETAQVVVAGCGLDPALLRMPSGLITPRTVHLIDRADILAARTGRLRAGRHSSPQLPTAEADPLDLDALADALTRLPLRGRSDLTVVLIGALPHHPLEALLALLGAVQALPTASRALAFEWFGPDLQRAPEALDALRPWGAPLPTQPLAIDLAARGLGASAVETSTLLRLHALPLAFGTSVTFN